MILESDKNYQGGVEVMTPEKLSYISLSFLMSVEKKPFFKRRRDTIPVVLRCSYLIFRKFNQIAVDTVRKLKIYLSLLGLNLSRGHPFFPMRSLRSGVSKQLNFKRSATSKLCYPSTSSR